MAGATKNRFILIIIFVTMTLITCTILLLAGLKRSYYPDFTQFPNLNVLNTFLESKLTINQTTKSEAQSFLIDQQMSRCGEVSNKETIHIISPNADEIIACWVQAPDNDLPNVGWLTNLIHRLTVTNLYSIDFAFSKGKLIGIYTKLSSNSW